MTTYVVPTAREDGDNHNAHIVGPRRAEIYGITEGQCIDLALQILGNHGRYTVLDNMTGKPVQPRGSSRERPAPRRRSTAARTRERRAEIRDDISRLENIVAGNRSGLPPARDDIEAEARMENAGNTMTSGTNYLINTPITFPGTTIEFVTSREPTEDQPF